MILFAEDFIPELIENYADVGDFLNSLGEQIDDDGCVTYYHKHLDEVAENLDKYGVALIEELYLRINNIEK